VQSAPTRFSRDVGPINCSSSSSSASSSSFPSCELRSDVERAYALLAGIRHCQEAFILYIREPFHGDTSASPSITTAKKHREGSCGAWSPTTLLQAVWHV